MATYTLTPAERKARAQALKQTRENRFMYQKYLDERKKLEEQQAAEEQARLDEESRIKNQNFLIRGLSTVGDVVANVITGAVKGLEGIVDLGIGLVGAVGGIFDGDFQDRVKNVISYDWTGETFGNALQEALKYSYTTNGGIIENVANGIGQMLPAVLVTVATAGAGAPAAIAQGASLATLGISAAGNSTESAFQEGADYWAGLGYGAASGLVEVATEKMFGGATKALTGAGIFDGITKSVADTGVRRIAKNALEEGVEEVVSELANPALKSIYKGKDALNEYGTVEYWKGVGEAGLVGSLTALAYSGSVGYGMSKLGVGYVGKEADIADSLSEIDSLKKKAINLQANDELFGANEQKIADTTRKNYQNIEKTLKSVSEEKRANFIKKFDLGNAFNPDGTMSEKMSSWLNVEQIDTDNTNNSDSALASPKKGSYSFSLRGREAEIQNDLNRIREDLVKQYAQDKNASTEEAMQKVGELKVFSEEMSDKAKESRKKFNKGLNYLNKISGGDVAFVITEANDSFNGNLVDGRTIYIGEDTFENDSWSGTLVHEYTHFSEGSEEYNRLLNFLQSDDIVVADGIKLWEKGQNAVLNKNYGFDSNKIKSIKEKLDSGKPITQDEQRYYDNFAAEVVAHETEYLLGNEEFIDRLVARESSLAQKVIKKIQNLSKMFNKVGDSQSKTQISQLKKAEKLYLKAASKAGEMRLVRMILSQDPELEREIDNSAEMQYNKKTRYSQYCTLATQWANNPKTNQGDIKILFNPDTNTYNKIVADSSYNVGYRVEKSVKDTAENAQKIEDLHREVYNEDNGAEQGTRENLHKNFEEYERQTRNFGDDLFDDKNEETNGQTRGVVEDESRGDGGGDYRKGRNDSRIVKYSLKDSEGRTLSQEQQEFFRDSKIRDKNGNLLVVYHGTLANEITRFDPKRVGERFSYDERGFFFISNKKIARDYATSDFDNAKQGTVIPVYINGKLPLVVDSAYLKTNGYPWGYFKENDCIDFWDTFQTPILEAFDKIKADSIIIDDGTNKMVVAFKPNQIKAISNTTPTLLEDIRYSFKDSEGRELSSQQQEYFKNSQVKDKEGNLLIVYHGSPSKFTKFSYQFMNTNGNAHGRGFYFTDNRDYAVDYQKENGQLLKGYLNIENPASESEITIKRNDIIKLIKAICQEEAKYAVENDGYESIKEALPDTFVSNYVDTYSQSMESVYNEVANTVLESSENDIDIIAELTNASSPRVVLPLIKNIVGYDGVIFTDETNGTNQFVAFTSNQFKNYDNETPTLNEDIRYQLKDNKQYFYELSDGQIKKLLADKTKMKVYSKAETEATVNTILETSLGIGEKYGKLSGKSKAEVIEMLWRGLNTAEPGKQMHVALDVAEYIIQNSVLENIYDDGENEANYFVVSVLKPYLHSLDLTGIKSDISYHYDRDNSPYLLWGKRRGDSGTAPDQLKAILEEQGFYVDSDVGADIFFQIDSAYREAVNSLKKKTKEVLTSALSSEERKELKNKIAREVLLSFDTTGKPSKLSKILDEYHKEARFWREKYYDERTRNSVVNRLLDKVQKVKDIKLGTFLNASQYKTDIFKKSIESLAKIKFRGDLNQSGTRNIVEGLREWYVESNPLLEGVYDSTISEMLTDISTGEGQLTTQELRNLSNIVDYFKHFIETYNKVYRNGQYVEAQPIAEKYVGIIKKNQNVKVGWLKKFFESYLTTFGDPMAVARYMDKYESGFFSEMLSSLREAATNAQIDEMNIREPIEEFIKKNKKYFSEATKRTITYNGKEIPLLQGLYVYMALNDVDTLASFAESGFSYNDGKTEVRIDGFAVGEELDDVSLREKAKSIQGSLEKQFNVLDKEYIEIAKKIFNEECRKRYSETSILLKGYSNAKEGDYVPIRRANIAKNVDTSSLEYEINRASNASFTKDRVKGAKGELRVEGLNTVLDRHIRAISQYTNLAPSIEEYNKLFNLNTVDNHNKPVSVATESRLSWEKGDEYFRKLISDIQGIPTTKGDGIKAMSFIRGSYAKYQLGANPKVWITQLSSFFASGSILDYSSIIKGLGIKTGDVDKYCQLAKLRNNDNTAAMAQGVIDDVGKVGNVLMKPIGAVDRFVVKKLFGACQIQVEKNNGLKVGTEENKVKAGELLKRVILETQQNSMSTERSAAMRSGSEFMRTITMFSADSMKVVGRVIDSIGELTSLKAKKKLLTDVKEIDEIDKKIKSSIKKVAKSTTSLITSAVFMALVAQLFRTLYNKDDKDDNIIENMTVDAVGNLLGGLPIFKDVYARFAEGYDIDGYAYSAINDLLDSAVNIFDMVGDIFSGEVDSKEIAKNIKNMVYAGGQVFGLPTRNIYNISYGLTKRFSPSTAYKIDNVFYNKNYSSDLKKAIEREDDEMISTIVGIMLDEKVGGVNDSNVRKELNALVSKGYSVLPRSVGNKISYDGEEVSLTNTQQEEFRRVYSVANEALASLVKLPQYESATDDIKAKAINYIYNVYYNLAIQDLLGVDLETKTILFAEALDVEKLAIIVSTANSLTADTDKKGNAISGSRKAKIQNYINSLKLTAVQKYMIMGYLGFKNTKGEVQVKAYINRLNLTKTEKDKLLKYSGYSG